MLEPSKRYSLSQVKSHPWMQLEPPPSGAGATPPGHAPHEREGHCPEVGQVNEQILRLMQSLGIDPNRTKEVSTRIRIEYN